MFNFTFNRHLHHHLRVDANVFYVICEDKPFAFYIISEWGMFYMSYNLRGLLYRNCEVGYFMLQGDEL